MFYDHKNKIYRTDEMDQCTNCENFEKCPLIEAIAHHIVSPNTEDFTVKNCSLFAGEAKSNIIKLQRKPK